MLRDALQALVEVHVREVGQERCHAVAIFIDLDARRLAFVERQHVEAEAKGRAWNGECRLQLRKRGGVVQSAALHEVHGKAVISRLLREQRALRVVHASIVEGDGIADDHARIAEPGGLRKIRAPRTLR